MSAPADEPLPEVVCFCGERMVLTTRKVVAMNPKAYVRVWACQRVWPEVCTGEATAGNVGCAPISKPADAETRRLRVEAHKVFDRLWRADGQAHSGTRRAATYRKMREALGLSEAEAHMAQMDAERCRLVIAWAQREAALRELEKP